MRGYTELTGQGAAFKLKGSVLFRLAGSDAASWLQGQVTNDLRLLDRSPYVDACLVRPTGQLQSVLRIWKEQDSLTALADRPSVLVARVEDFVILEDVALELVSDDVWTWQSSSSLDSGLPSPRTAPFGADVIGRPGGVPEADMEAWSLATLERGLALHGVDSTDKTLPPELGPDFDQRHIAYDKGCYVGQEILQRIHSRGHTNKTWVVLSSELVLSQGDEVRLEGDLVGQVTRAHGSPRFGPLAGAVLMNRARTVGTMLDVRGVPAKVVEPPASVL